MYKRLNGDKSVFHEHLPNGRRLKSLRIGSPGGQTLNTVPGGILHLLIPQHLDYGTNKQTNEK